MEIFLTEYFILKKNFFQGKNVINFASPLPLKTTMDALATTLSTGLEQVLASELFESAEILGTMLLAVGKTCDADGAETSPTGRALQFYGDALYGQNQFRRAQSYYRKASHRQSIDRENYESPAVSEVMKLREAKCCLKAKDLPGALAALEQAEKTPKIQIEIAKIYLEQNLKKLAIENFESAFRDDPLCVECIEPLAKLYGSSAHDSFTKLLLTARRKSELRDWLETFVRIHAALAAHEYAAALRHIEAMDRLLGSPNLHCLLRAGKAHYELGNVVDAQYTSFYTVSRLNSFSKKKKKKLIF